METTIDYLRWQGQRIADQAGEEARHLFHKWGSHDGTADQLKELSTVAANLAAAWQKVAGDALEMAESLDPTPIGFDAFTDQRARLWLVKREELAGEVRAGDHMEDVS